jgi:hypothetical protein
MEWLLPRQKDIEKSNQLLASFADCKELGEFRKGRRWWFENYGFITAQTPNGQARVIKGVSRAEFIKRLSAGFGDRAQRLKQVETRLRRQLPEQETHSILNVLDTDNNGVYLAHVISVADDAGSTASVLFMTGATLINETSVAINLYQTYQEIPDLLALLAREKAALANLIQAND